MSIEDDVRRLQVDMWEGQGPNNPSVVVRLATIEGDMALVKEGVSNFRDHAERATKFFSSAEAVWAADTRRRARNLKVVLVVIPCLLAAMGWAIVQGGNLVIRILQIEQQWQQAHPSEFVRPQQMFNENQPEQASKDMAY